MKKSSVSYDLLFECCTESINVDKLNALIHKVEDWREFLHRIFMHGVLPLVYKRLQNKELDVPKDILLNLKQAYISIAKMNMLMTAELIKIFKFFEDHNIKALPFKGPTLSQLLYKDVTLGQYCDLDILVDENSLNSAARLLIKHNYEMNFSEKFLKNKQYLAVGKDIPLKNNDSNILVELHWKLFENKFVFNDNTFFNQHQQITINNQTFNTLEYENLLLYLCIHGSKHFWERLEWIVDIDRLIRKKNEINWISIKKQVDAMQVNRMFYLGLLVAYELFETPLPQTIHNAIAKTKEIHTLKDKVLVSIYNNNINTDKDIPIDFEIISYLNALTDNKYSSFKFQLRSYFMINNEDVLTINLPPYLSSLYYIIRLFRIGYKYLSHIQKN